MATNSESDLASFRRFLDFHLESGQVSMTPEEALRIWREQSVSPEDIVAVQQALQEMRAGDRGMPVDQFLRTFQQEGQNQDG